MSYLQANQLITRIQADMRQAMKDRDTAKLSILRSLSARISNAEAVPASSTSNAGVGSTEATRRQLTLDDIQHIITAELHEIETTLDAVDETSAYAADLRQKAAIIQAYLVT